MAERVLAAVDETLGDALRAAGPPGLGIADGRFAAQVAAQSAARSRGSEVGARVLVVDPDASPSFLAPLPLRWLLDAGEVTTDLVELVARLGVGSLGAFAALAFLPGLWARRHA
jgi:hypothetical protein